MTKPDLRTAIIDLANAQAEPGQPVNLYSIGPTLILEMGFPEGDIVNALDAMKSAGVIDLIGDNRIVVIPAASRKS